MKLWALFLALYVLVLSGLPCEALCLDESTATTQQTADSHEHDETCSPFCLCATCPGFTVPASPHLIAILLPAAPIPVAEMPSYRAPLGCEVPGRIWQPPRSA